MGAEFIKIGSSGRLAELFAESADRPVVLFKHSATCPISSGVYREVARLDSIVNLVVVQTDRPISDEIAERTGVRHESPQAIVLRNGRAVYHASHYDVIAEDVSAHLEK